MYRQIFLNNFLIMLLLSSCMGESREKKFLAKYEFEIFSQFKGVKMFNRGSDNQENIVIFGYAPDLKNDSSKKGYFFITLDKENHQAIKTKWTLIEECADADTTKLQKLVQTFITYEIPRLDVDEKGNVYVYSDLDKLAFIRFVDKDELSKYPHQKLVNIKDNWYKPK